MAMQPGVAWVIGGGSGIGAAVARLLAERGWTVAISGRRPERLEAVAREHDAIRPYPLDVTDPSAIEPMVARIVAELGRIDLFIFGAASEQGQKPGEYGFDAFMAIVDANYLGLVRLAQPVLTQMELQGGGHFAIIASLAGYFGLPRAAAYGSSKAGLISLAQTMRSEMAPRGVAVRLVSPGFVKSELTARNDFPMPLLMETDAAAQRIVDGLTKTDRFEIAFPRRMAWLMKAIRILPYPLFFALMTRLLRR